MTEDERVARGHRARAELQLTEEAFDAVRGELIKEMIASNRPDEVMQCRNAVTALDKVRSALGLVIADGQVAAAILEVGLKN